MWAFQYVPTLKAPMGATLHLLHVLLRGVVMWYIRKMSTKLSVKRTCGNSCLLLFPAPQAGCFSCLPAHTVCFSPLHDFFALSLSVDANMFLVFFFSFSTFLSVLSPFQIPEQCRVISQQCYAFINTNKQLYTNMFLPERALDTNCRTSCLVDTHADTHTY